MAPIRARALALLAILFACLGGPALASAQGRSPGRAQAREARDLFGEAERAAEEERWGEALELYRRSFELYPRAPTLLNMASVLIRLGRYREANRTLDQADGMSLPAPMQAAVAAMRRTLEGSLGVLELRLSPPEAEVTMDGEPVEGEGARREISLDPGEHNLTFEAEGHERRRESLSAIAGERLRREVALRPLSARLILSSNAPDAVIRVDGEEVGVGSATVPLAAGAHRVTVSAGGFAEYEREIELENGQELRLSAELGRGGSVAEDPIFWTVIGAVVLASAVGIGVGIWYDTQPDYYHGTTGILFELGGP